MSGLTNEDKEFINDGIEKALSQGTTRIRQTVRAEIDTRFTAFGFDVKSPVEVQKDMAMLSAIRKLAESISTKIILFLVAGAAASAFILSKFKSGQ